MLRKILVCDLTVGMYIHEFCRPWVDDPFWINNVESLLQDAAVLERIWQSSTTEVWIDTARGLQPSVNSAAAAPGTQQEIPTVSDASPSTMNEELARARMICGRAKAAVIAMFSEAKMGRAIQSEDVDLMVEEISNSVMRNPHALISLSRLKTSDEYTYMHSVAVCALMVALARQMALSEAQVREAGVAGLMHDVGKMMISNAILNKPDRLTPDEFETMKYHPEAGVKILQENHHMTQAVKDVCLHHHEKIDGTGYPHHLSGDQISVFAKMGAICDVYDAVTSERPYKKGWDAAYSIREMASWKGHFDPMVFQHFVRTVGIYPVGALVRLKSEQLGVVIEQSSKSLLKPVVKVFMSTRTRMNVEPAVINLAHPDTRDAIVKFELAQDWGIGNVDALWSKSSVG
ncbi:HD-GYP domain-containing protein [Pseudomonas huanghezhanensis]|uniref:HD-GYP domain-containing protein n=1 Tax=Pseudomonas huanghezhanensis TaxID=3002903 RepID=UPI002285D51C|nr:HD-GYP domain-containing protein [Pseudomonas sp. BSw22131]